MVLEEEPLPERMHKRVKGQQPCREQGDPARAVGPQLRTRSFSSKFPPLSLYRAARVRMEKQTCVYVRRKARAFMCVFWASRK